MKRMYLFLALLLCFGSYSFYAIAQDETDALRYSYLSPQGTARSMGFGGALGSIGGDFAALGVNPAGIGVYRSSEFTFTPSLKINSTSGKYQGTTTNDNNTRFTINNLGVVFTSAARGKRYQRSQWKAVSFGLGINRIADFNRNYSYNGRMPLYDANNKLIGSSGGEAFSIDANNYPTDIDNTNTLAGMGYQSYLLDTSGGRYVPLSLMPDALNQGRIVKERGGITDINISFGGNYQEKLMLGATLGVPALRYKRDVTYTETDATGNHNNNFESLAYKESLTTTGSGINLKLGFIYKPVDEFRIGAAIHTPTYFSLKDAQNRSLTTNTENFKYNIGEQDINPITKVTAAENLFEYSLITPWRGVISAAGFLGTHGFITADYEYVNYASARFNYQDGYADAESEVNQLIKKTYRGASNIRVGAEGRIENFSIRVGFGYYGTPYQDKNAMGDRMDFSGGLGFRQDSWFLDLAFVHSQYEHTEHPYVLNYNPVIAPTSYIKNNLNNVALTLGFKF